MAWSSIFPPEVGHPSLEGDTLPEAHNPVKNMPALLAALQHIYFKKQAFPSPACPQHPELLWGERAWCFRANLIEDTDY